MRSTRFKLLNSQITAEIQAEINEQVLKRHAYLQGEIDKMTPIQLKLAQDRFAKAMDAATTVLNRRLPRILKVKTLMFLNAGIYFASTAEMREANPLNNPHRVDVPAGIARIDQNCILIHNHLLLAPVEVIKCLVTHEYLHHVFRQYRPIAENVEDVDDMEKDEYSEGNYNEEKWVRLTEKKVTGQHGRLLEVWEAAVELAAENWRSAYYKLKQIKK